MMTKIEKLPKAAIKMTVTVENSKVKDSYEKVLEEKVKSTSIEGFRLGSAPKEMVKEKVGVSNIYGDVINELLQTFYPQALRENHISPVSNPKVEIKEFEIEKDFEFTATVATMPEVTVGDYKSALPEAYKKKFEDAKKETKDGEEPHVHMGTNEVIEVLLSESKVDIADILLEEETDRLLSRFMDQAQSIGLSMEQYLKAQNKTAEQLRGDYTKIAEANLKAEFVLSHLIKESNIEVTEEEVEETIKAVGDPKLVGGNDPMQRLYIKSILQKNKLISKLIELAEGEHHHEHK